jgi:hypothetical protein
MQDGMSMTKNVRKVPHRATNCKINFRKFNHRVINILYISLYVPHWRELEKDKFIFEATITSPPPVNSARIQIYLFICLVRSSQISVHFVPRMRKVVQTHSRFITISVLFVTRMLAKNWGSFYTLLLNIWNLINVPMLSEILKSCILNQGSLTYLALDRKAQMFFARSTWYMGCPGMDMENLSIESWQLEVRGNWITRGSRIHPHCVN